MSLKLAVIPGDGIGPEVIAEAVKVLDAVLPGTEKTEYDLGARRYHATGEILPDSVLEEIRGHDVILLGAIGDPSVPSGVLERGLLLHARFALDHHVNLRPSRLYPGVDSPLADPPEIDFLVVREGTEGPYTGNGGALRVGTAHEVATEVSVNTAFGVARVVRFAFEKARARRRHLTLVHKNNVLAYAGSLWTRTVAEIGKEYPDVETAYTHVDAATIYMVTDPGRFDVIVSDNLFGDIITDLAGAVCGESVWRPAATSTPPASTRRCSSRCTAARPTSPPGHRRPDRGGHVGGHAAGPHRRERCRRSGRRRRREAPGHPRRAEAVHRGHRRADSGPALGHRRICAGPQRSTGRRAASSATVVPKVSRTRNLPAAVSMSMTAYSV